MTDLVLSTFQRASFRGVPFLYTDLSQSGGRKYKTFEYPNQDDRVTQDLGGLQRIYKMTATIAATTFNYKILRQQLIDALEQEGAGILVHPIEGVKSVYAHPYSLSEGLSHIGTATFELTFQETGEQLYPDQSPSNAASIANQLNELIGTIDENFASIWATVSTFEGNIEYSSDLVEGTVEAFTNAGNIVTADADSYNNYIKSLNELSANTYRYATDASGLSTNIQTLFSEGGQLGQTTTDNLSIMASFFAYNPFPPVNQITVGTEERERNRLISNQLMNAMAWAYYALFVANTSFDTEDDIDDQHNALNDQFSFIIENNTYVDINGASFPMLSDNTLAVMENIRYQAHQSLTSQTASARKLVNTIVQADSLLPLTYQYYDDLTLYPTLYGLNNLRDATNIISQDFKVLTDEN